MFITPKHTNAHIPSTWTAALCMIVLAVGVHGASHPVIPKVEIMTWETQSDDEIMLEEFDPPAGDTVDEEPTDPTEEIEPEFMEMEIPPIPEIAEPITPPEMAEITPVEEIVEEKKPEPVPVQKPKPQTPKPQQKRKPAAMASANPTTGTGTPGGGGTGTGSSKRGGGKGRFPHPSYPSAARSAGLQGTVRLSVTVEASGLPGSVRVQASSGHSVLDNAAVDHVRRRWRWPSGDVRHYVVPIRFVLTKRS